MAKKKTVNMSNKIAAIVCVSCLVLVGGIVGVKAVDNGFSWSDVESLVADRLFGEAVGDGFGGTGETHTSGNQTGLYDLTLKDSDSSEDNFWLSRKVFRGTIGTASSTFLSIENASGNDWLVDRMTVAIDGAASGTFRASCGTSTIGYHTTAVMHGALGVDPITLFNQQIPTSTAAGIYSSSTFTSAGQSVAIERVANDEFILCGLWSGDLAGPNAILSTTSTASRGFSASSWYTVEILEYATST